MKYLLFHESYGKKRLDFVSAARLVLFFFFSPVQQTASNGIGHRVKCFFSGWQPMR